MTSVASKIITFYPEVVAQAESHFGQNDTLARDTLAGTLCIINGMSKMASSMCSHFSHLFLTV